MSERVEWEFVVWSEEGSDGWSVCLHRGDLLSDDHVCLGYQPTKALAEKQVALANDWLQAQRAAAKTEVTKAWAHIDEVGDQHEREEEIWERKLAAAEARERGLREALTSFATARFADDDWCFSRGPYGACVPPTGTMDPWHHIGACARARAALTPPGAVHSVDCAVAVNPRHGCTCDG